MGKGWWGVDLDCTLAYYDRWRGIDHIGEPIQPMVERVKRWLAWGREVKIVTARVGPGHDDHEEARRHIQDWCEKHIGARLQVVAHKDGGMIRLYDDRAVQVERNTGRIIGDE